MRVINLILGPGCSFHRNNKLRTKDPSEVMNGGGEAAVTGRRTALTQWRRDAENRSEGKTTTFFGGDVPAVLVLQGTSMVK